MLYRETGTQGRFPGWKWLGPSLGRLVGAWDCDAEQKAQELTAGDIWGRG